MNRDIRRMMGRREKAADRMARPTKRKRAKPREFIKQVRDELARVSWPTRSEVVVYTIVVLVSVAFFMSAIALMDWAFSRGVLEVVERGAG
jgi:preprotein translocase subunit SecE